MTNALKTLLVGALNLAFVLSLTGCGGKGTVVRADDYDSKTVVDVVKGSEITHKDKATADPHRQPTTKRQLMDTPLDGEWIIIKAAGKDIKEDDDMPYVIFSDAEGKFYASNGCNVINGNYDYKSNNTLTLSNVVSTRMACPDNHYQRDISTVLAEGVSVRTKIEDKHRETYLVLSTMSGEPLMTLRRHNLEVINGQWEVESIGKEEVDGSEINLFFDIPERSVHGNTGCNYFNGVIVIDPDQESHISFSQMGVTMRYCDNADTERKLLVALEETEGYELKGNTLHLTDGKGKTLVTLKKLIIEN